MRAALRKGIKKVEVIEMDKPSPAADEVLVAVKSCGICGSDIVRVQEENPRWDEIVLGHEFAGKIVAVGENVEGWNVGDRASAAPLMPCMKCDKCARATTRSVKATVLSVPAFKVLLASSFVCRPRISWPSETCPMIRLRSLADHRLPAPDPPPRQPAGQGRRRNRCRTIGLLAIQIFKPWVAARSLLPIFQLKAGNGQGHARHHRLQSD